MDAHIQVCDANSPYTIRLNKLTEGLTSADGSVRVFSSLMDIMTDEELLGVIGHEIGHVAHHDSKKGFRTALLASALKDGVASNGGAAATLTDSQLGSLSEALVNATYSKKQDGLSAKVRQAILADMQASAARRPQSMPAFLSMLPAETNEVTAVVVEDKTGREAGASLSHMTKTETERKTWVSDKRTEDVLTKEEEEDYNWKDIWWRAFWVICILLLLFFSTNIFWLI